MTDEDETIFSRWSRRKRAAVDESEGEAQPEAPIEQTPQLSEGEWLAQNNQPAPEDLQEGDDFSAFLKADVPDMLRRRALRQLWRSNPALANLDGLVDYGDDFTDAATVPDVIATAYKVGKGMVDAVLEDSDPKPPAGSPDDAQVAEEKPEAADVASNANSETDTLAADAEGHADEEDETEVAFRPRRMSFKPD